MFFVISATASLAEDAAGPESTTPGFFTKAVWYVPNRILDLLDIVRFRVGVGPGLEIGQRITDVGSLYFGHSRTVWVGLPGERAPGELPHFMGASQKEGLVMFGVDATDVQPNPPRYDFSEIGIQLHLAAVGVEAGIIPKEIADFLFGLFGKDVSKDDLPATSSSPPPGPGRVLQLNHYELLYPLTSRPDTFQNTEERLDYLHENLPVRLRGYMHSTDRALVDEKEDLAPQPPVTDLEIGVWSEYISGPDGKLDIDQRFRVDLEFPNVERNLSLFFDSDYNDDLPGTDLSESETQGFVLGFRRQLKKMNISSDLGVKWRLPPRLFARIRYRPSWTWGEHEWGFEQRLFWNNEDGFGSLTHVRGYRWLGTSHHWLFRNLTAGRISESTDGLEWQQTFSLGHMTDLVDEENRLENLGTNDTVQCMALTASVFGKDRRTDTYRTTFLFRYPIHKTFVLLEAEPGLEWREEHDWTTQYRFDLGVVLLF